MKVLHVATDEGLVDLQLQLPAQRRGRRLRLVDRLPITGIAGCCARAASGHAAAAPPRSEMKSRRFISLPYLGSLLSNCCATRMMSSYLGQMRVARPHVPN